jgi:hypothetical protein
VITSYKEDSVRHRSLVLTAALSAATAVASLAQEMKPKPMTAAEKISNAASAAPASISAAATILDWPASEGAKPAILRQGSNGWVCYPDMPMTEGNDPMCLDRVWQVWLDAYAAKTTPTITTIGVGYMVAPGGAWGSNTDPYATAKAADNQWGYDPPHIMLLLPATSLTGLSTDRGNGGPWVMWAGTPYAHVMVPLTGGPKPMDKRP